MLDATKAFSIVLTDPQDVVGLPESLLKLTAEAAATDDVSNLDGSRYFFRTCLNSTSVINFRGHQKYTSEA